MEKNRNNFDWKELLLASIFFGLKRGIPLGLLVLAITFIFVPIKIFLQLLIPVFLFAFVFGCFVGCGFYSTTIEDKKERKRVVLILILGIPLVVSLAWTSGSYFYNSYIDQDYPLLTWVIYFFVIYVAIAFVVGAALWRGVIAKKE